MTTTNKVPALTIEQMSFITNTVVSVIRDRVISGSYGFLASELRNSNLNCAPKQSYPEDLLSALFDANLVKEISRRIFEIFPNTNVVTCPIYTTDADLISQLFRLLSVLRENTPFMDPYIDKLNASIKEMNFQYERWTKYDDIIRHLRNTVCHCHFEAQKRGNETVILFKDFNRGIPTAKIVVTLFELNMLIDMILEAYKQFFLDHNWTI